eukprot:TRINITY_DN125005_c0_g1_i1.p1 TRINITY_DN125005_c0_g1~~TRINITY_DN125005_c0_g1_i1.p1  ORF type:complete len:171 (+),score=13.06 TRINITY_DN125005_c0_g1_i1:98-610(+)
MTLECNICLESAFEPVVTRCGHLFCWQCLHQWLHQPRRSPVHGGLQPSTGSSVCPVCKAGVAVSNVTPIYAKGDDAIDPRTTTVGAPARPTAERLEPEDPPPEVADLGFGGGRGTYGVAAGYGQFPVVCTLALCGPGLDDLRELPVGSTPKMRLGLLTLIAAAIMSMLLM